MMHLCSSLRSAAILGVCLGLACASPIKTSHDFDPDADLQSYQSYAWISDDPLIKQQSGVEVPTHISPIDDQRIRRAVDREMSVRGFQRAASKDEADLVVSYTVGTEDKIRVSDTGGGYYGGYGYGYGYGGWYGGSQVRVDQYKEGTLSIELWDQKTRQAVWVGWGSKRLSRERDDDPALIDEVVVKILQPLPARTAAP